MILRRILRVIGHLSWLRFGVRDRIIRFFHNPDTSGSQKFSVPFFGAVYTGNFDTFIDWSVYYFGAYAREELRLFDDFLKELRDPIVLDVGANVGHHALFAAMRSKKVLAFEPFLDVAKELERKVSVNGLSNVELLQFALGEKDEIAAYVKPSGNNTGTGSFVNSQDAGDTLSLPIRNGDKALAECGVADVGFVKIDTEGFEPFVLRGLSGTLARCRPLVFFEWTQGQRGLLSPQGEELFPDNYQVFQFISDTVIFGLFRKPTYRLSPVPDFWPDGNLFAVPQEYIERVRTERPSSAAAKQLEVARTIDAVREL